MSKKISISKSLLVLLSLLVVQVVAAAHKISHDDEVVLTALVRARIFEFATAAGR
jgi:hypothetical protein